MNFRISQINLKSNYIPSFGSNSRFYKIGPYKSTVYTQTEMLRHDLDFKDFAMYLKNQYKDKQNVNVYNFACSDGSEPYSLAICLFETLGVKDAQKFFPINASDSDFIIIKSAQNGIINMSNKDLETFEKYNIDWKKYFKPSDRKYFISADKMDEQTNSYFVSDILKDKVKFNVATILKDTNNIKQNDDNIVLCRNVLPYQGTKSEILMHLKAITNNLSKGNLLLIGDYDRDMFTIDYLTSKGFEEIQHNVFRKNK